MKNVKKLLSILVVLTLVLSLGATAFAATVTLPDDAQDHTMVAYQIFVGAQEEPSDTNAQLGVTGWGAAVSGDPDAFLRALIAAGYTGFKVGMTAVQAADVIGKMSFADDADRVAFANAVAAAVDGKSSTSFVGNSADLGTGYWVIVDKSENLPAGENRSTVLLEVVGATLTLKDKIDQPTLEKTVDDGSATVAGVGEDVSFKLEAKLPSNFADYASYTLTFNDTMSAGLTLDENSFQITIAGGAATPVTPTITHNEDGTTSFTFTTDDLKQVEGLAAGATITLTYTAKVNANAVVREFNKASLSYPTDPSAAGGGEPGTTPEEHVTVFSFTVDGSKVQPDPENGEDATKPLAGAGFTLFKQNGEAWDKIGDESVSGEDGKFGFKALGAGVYKIEETTVPAGFNKADDIYFTVVETKDNDGNVTGAELREWDPVEKKAGNVIDENVNITFTTDAGTGTYEKEVINQSGLELPETGGIGTTIFYVIGAILVAGAVILLVTRKRMSGADK